MLRTLQAAAELLAAASATLALLALARWVLTP